MSEYLTEGIAVNGSSEGIKLSVKRYSLAPAMKSTRSVVFLLAHANGLCKELWEPSIRHIFNDLSKQDGSLACDAYSWDARNHGDSAILNGLNLKTFDNWWDAGRDALEVIRWVKSVHGENATYIGVGHSFGACQLLMAEILEPKSLTTLVLFEPVVMNQESLRVMFGIENISELRPEMVAPARAALRRKATFESREDTLNNLKSKPFFKTWTAESLSLYVSHGFVEVLSVTTNTKQFTLKCTPEQESAVFATGSPADIYEGMKNVLIPTLVVMGELTDHVHMPFMVNGQALIRDEHLATLPRNGSFKLLKGLGHMSVMEDPRAAGIEYI